MLWNDDLKLQSFALAQDTSIFQWIPVCLARVWNIPVSKREVYLMCCINGDIKLSIYFRICYSYKSRIDVNAGV